MSKSTDCVDTRAIVSKTSFRFISVLKEKGGFLHLVAQNSGVQGL